MKDYWTNKKIFSYQAIMKKLKVPNKKKKEILEEHGISKNTMKKTDFWL